MSEGSWGGSTGNEGGPLVASDPTGSSVFGGCNTGRRHAGNFHYTSGTEKVLHPDVSPTVCIEMGWVDTAPPAGLVLLNLNLFNHQNQCIKLRGKIKSHLGQHMILYYTGLYLAHKIVHLIRKQNTKIRLCILAATVIKCLTAQISFK